MNLSLLHPALLWGLLAAAIPLVIHLFYRRRPKPLHFPAIDFILRARRETERRVRLKRILLFLARTALLAAAALALTRPRAMRPEAAAATGPSGPSVTAVVLDASASMGYRLGGSTLFERARSDALEVLDGLGSEEPATVLVCGGAGAPSAPAPSFDRAALRRALREAELTAGYADLTACVGAAVRALSDSATAGALRKRLAIATDLTASAWRLDVAAPVIQTPSGAVRPEVTLLDAARGAALPNVAVTALAAEPDPAVGARGFRITATVANSGKEPLHDLALRLEIGSGKDLRTPIHTFADVPAGGATKKSLSYDFGAGGPAVLSVGVAPDALPMDDRASLALIVPREVKALLVNGSPSPIKYRDEAFFVESALASSASPVRPTVVDAESLPRARFADYDVVFLLNVRSIGAKAAELQAFVEAGGGLFVAVGDEVDPDRYDAELAKLLPEPLHVVKTAGERGGAGRAAHFADIDWEHPALAVFSGPAREGFEGVRIFRYMLLKPERAKKEAASAERVLARYDDGAPALVEARRGRGHVILYTSTVDREWTDWTIRTSFLPTMQRLAAYLAGGLEEQRSEATVVLAPRTLTLAAGARLVSLVAPDGRERSAASLGKAKPAEAQAGAGPDAPQQLRVVPDQPGIWQVKVEEGGAARVDPKLSFAVLPDPRESDTARLDPAELTAYFGGATHAKIAGDGRGAGEGRTIPLWSLLLIVAIGAFFAEGLLLR
jgi:hypothetical protein